MFKLVSKDSCFAIVILLSCVLTEVAFGTPSFQPDRRRICLEALMAETPGWSPAEGSGPEERWGFDGQDGAQFYNKDFANMLRLTGDHSFSEILIQRRAAGRSTHVADLFGSGFFVEDQSQADSITGVRWGPFSTESNGDAHLDKLIARMPPTPPQVFGDLMNPRTWDTLRVSMVERGIPAFDLIAMRPDGGWQQASFSRTANQNVLAIGIILKNVIRLLAKDGRFYFSIHIPQLPGDLTNHPLLGHLTAQITRETPFRLLLSAKVSRIYTTYALEGALLPK